MKNVWPLAILLALCAVPNWALMVFSMMVQWAGARQRWDARALRAKTHLAILAILAAASAVFGISVLWVLLNSKETSLGYDEVAQAIALYA